ncbi:hypothetical protein [uncultured Desulfovibrio sp.]|uniref:hypothetical protein n=1 Tax=uncultured Desulfovibrio sp. TaxID=167968 RepID=UPI002620ACBA|nr:hypothetical protein [uncultured Desulfovibrio sp.]
MNIIARVRGGHVSFGARHVPRQADFCAPAVGITMLAGRLGSGKTALLRALNRLDETFPSAILRASRSAWPAISPCL